APPQKTRAPVAWRSAIFTWLLRVSRLGEGDDGVGVCERALSQAAASPSLPGCSVGFLECVGNRFVARHLLAFGEQLRRGLLAERRMYGRQRVFVQAGLVGLSGLAGLVGDVVGRTEETCCPARVVVCVCHGSESEEN